MKTEQFWELWKYARATKEGFQDFCKESGYDFDLNDPGTYEVALEVLGQEYLGYLFEVYRANKEKAFYNH